MKKKKWWKALIVVLIVLQIILLIPQLGIRVSLFLLRFSDLVYQETNGDDTLTTSIAKVDLPFAAPSRLFWYRYYELGQGPVESEYYSELKVWRATNVLGIWNVVHWMEERNLLYDVTGNSITSYALSGEEQVYDTEKCSRLTSLMGESGYVLSAWEYQLEDLTAEEELLFHVNQNTVVRLLQADERFGYIEIQNPEENRDVVFAVLPAVYQALRTFLTVA